MMKDKLSNKDIINNIKKNILKDIDENWTLGEFIFLFFIFLFTIITIICA